MKSHTLKLRVLAFAVILACTPGLPAQTAKPAPTPKQVTADGRPMFKGKPMLSAQQRFEQLNKALALSEEAKPQVKTLLETSAQKIKELVKEKDLTQAQMFKKIMTEVIKDEGEQLKKVLTAEQLKKYYAMPLF